MQLTGKRFNTKDAYSVLKPHLASEDPHRKHIWDSAVPNKVKIFSWLYFKDRPSSRANVFHKHVLDDDKCERCTDSIEDRHHIFDCPSISSLWPRLGMDVCSHLCVPNPSHWTWDPSIPLSILWQLWNTRNGQVFQNERASVTQIINRLWSTIWSKRFLLKKICTPAALQAWLLYLQNCRSLSNVIFE